MGWKNTPVPLIILGSVEEQLEIQTLDLMCSMCNAESETVSKFVLRCQYFSVERNNFCHCNNSYSPFSRNNKSRKLSYILDVCYQLESIRYCCKYIESINRRGRFVQWHVWMYLRICTWTCMYNVSVWQITMVKAQILQPLCIWDTTHIRIFSCYCAKCEISVTTYVLYFVRF